MPTVADLERFRTLLSYRWECDVSGCDGLPHQGFSHKHARAKQVVGDAYITFFCTGRGWGKSRAASQYIAKRMMENPKHRVNCVAPTFAVGRDVCIEGESGLLSVIPPGWIDKVNRSLGEVTLKNGSMLKTFSAYTKDDAEAIRGSQSHTVWMEEAAQWRQPQLAFDMAQFANRLGQDPRVVITATPKNTPLMRKLFNDKKIDRRSGSTFDNAENLALETVNYLKEKYEGTRLGAQELDGLLLEDVVGALWTRDMLRYLDTVDLSDMQRIVVSVDPPGSHRTKGSAEAGITVIGKRDELLYVLEDASQVATPEQWSTIAVDLYEKYQADAIVAETNFGGAMVQSTLRATGYGARVKLVNASRGKQLRAEPVVNLFERRKVAFVGPEADFVPLSGQLCSWIPPGQTERDEDGVETPIEPSSYSPDRLDSMVHGITELALQPKRRRAKMTCHPSSHMVRGY